MTTIYTNFFNKYNLKFTGGGVQPFIHPVLLKKKKRFTKKRKSNKKHRFRPGTVCIREIKKLQKKSNCLMLPKAPFKKLSRYIINTIANYEHPLKISKDAFIIIQYFIEQQIVEIVQKSNLVAIYAGRVKLIPDDIMFVCRLLNINYKYCHKTQTTSQTTLAVEDL